MEGEGIIEKKEILVYLDFNDKIPKDLLENEIFIRVANISDKHPLIQVNDMVYKGTYGYSVGTNLFLKKVPNENPNQFPFQTPTTHKVEFYAAQTRTIYCQQMRVPPMIAIPPPTDDHVNYNFQYDYQELLKKFEDGTLDINSMVKTNESESPKQHSPAGDGNTNIQQEELQMEVEEPELIDNDDNSSESSDTSKGKVETLPNKLKMNYEALQILARKPLRHADQDEHVEVDPKYTDSYNLNCIKSKILEPPFFSYFKPPETSNIIDSIDIERCTKLGLISEGADGASLTDDEKKALFKIENFENLGLSARYAVLTNLVDKLEEQIKHSSSQDNSKEDEFGRTPLRTLEILKDIVVSLEKRIQEIISASSS